MNQAPGKTYLKVTGILEIIFGVIGLISGILLLAAGGLIGAEGAAAAGIDAETAGLLGTISGAIGIVGLIGGAFNLVVGILGVKNCNKPEKAGVCFVLGIIMLVLGALSIVATLLTDFTLTNLVTDLVGCIIPACYTYGASLNKKAAQGK